MSRDVIDGSQVIEVQAWNCASPPGSVADLNGKKFTPVDQVSECLLADGRVVYRCNSKNDPTRQCPYWNVNPVSVRSHLRTHSDRMLVKRAAQRENELQAQLDEIAEKEAAEFKRRSDGRKAANVRRREQSADAASVSVLEPVTRAHVATQKMLITNKLDQLLAVLLELGGMLMTVHSELRAVAEDVDKLADSDPDLQAKADKYDQLRGLIQ